MRARILSAFVLVVAVCVSVSLYRDAGGQVPPLVRPPSFPPHPADIVNVDGTSTFIENVGFDAVAYTVPTGKWLVLTDVRVFGETNAVRIVQRSGGADIDKLSSPWTTGASGKGECQSEVGYAFPPGCAVVVKIDAVVPGNGTYPFKVDWNFVGYLSN